MIPAVIDDTLVDYMKASILYPRVVFLGMCIPPADRQQHAIHYMCKVLGTDYNPFAVIFQRYNPYQKPNWKYEIKFGLPPIFRMYDALGTEIYERE